MPYYSEVEKWSNIHAYQIGLGGSYGYGLKTVKLSEIVCHYGCIVGDGKRGGTSGTIYRLWQMGSEYDDDIAQEMKYWHWIQMKK